MHKSTISNTTGTPSPLTPAIPNEHTREFAIQLLQNFGDIHMVNTKTNEHIVTPDEVFELFKNILRNLSAGKAVSIVPYDAELTTHQAAHFLNVSRPFLIKLLEAGEIPHHKVGTHRRVQFDHLLAYKKQQKDRTKKSLKKLTGLSQEYGLY